jgi:hypothetical protein
MTIEVSDLRYHGQLTQKLFRHFPKFNIDPLLTQDKFAEPAEIRFLRITVINI